MICDWNILENHDKKLSINVYSDFNKINIVVILYDSSMFKYILTVADFGTIILKLTI